MIRFQTDNIDTQEKNIINVTSGGSQDGLIISIRKGCCGIELSAFLEIYEAMKLVELLNKHIERKN